MTLLAVLSSVRFAKVLNAFATESLHSRETLSIQIRSFGPLARRYLARNTDIGTAALSPREEEGKDTLQRKYDTTLSFLRPRSNRGGFHIIP